MKSVKINRKEWFYTGSLRTDYGVFCSSLYEPRVNRSCCLGHALRQLYGIPKSRLEFVSMPGDINFGLFPEFNQFDDTTSNGFCSTLFSEEASSINDSRVLSTQEKEQLLIDLFKKQGIELSFYGEFE